MLYALLFFNKPPFFLKAQVSDTTGDAIKNFCRPHNIEFALP